MKKEKILTGLLSIFLLSVVAFAGLTYAYRGDPAVKGPNYNADVHEQLQNAIENKDYDAWIRIREENNLPMKGRMFQVINKDNFDLFAEMHAAMISGDYERANEIRAELGLGQGMMKRGNSQGRMMGQSNGNYQMNRGSYCNNF